MKVPVLFNLFRHFLSTITYKNENRGKDEEEYLQSDDIFFLLFDEESIEFLELVFQQLDEIDLLFRHVTSLLLSGIETISGIQSQAFVRPVSGFGIDELQLLLEFLVGKKLVSPFR